MSLFYTNVRKYGKELLVKEVHNGKRTKMKVRYKPYLFITNNKPTEDDLYSTVWGQPVMKVDFDDMKEAKEFTETYKDVSGFEWHGMSDFQYPFMNDSYSGEFDPEYINVTSLDIETMSDDGFPEAHLADKMITAITLHQKDSFVVIGMGKFVPHQDNIRYIDCPDEETLLRTFVEEFAALDIDIVTGWNVDKFDITYLCNRILKVLGEKWMKRLSPWGIVQNRTKKDVDKNEYEGFDIFGISVLDYMDLYKKWTFVKRESYSLKFIGEIEELDVEKLDYSDEYRNLHDLYTRNYQLYIEYNIRDTEVVTKLDEKLKLIGLVLAVAYQAKVNYNDTFSPVKTWDVIIHNYLLARNQVVPQNRMGMRSDEEFKGGFVKEPIPGLYEWVVSEDLDSLYPHIIMQNNISPEKYKGKLNIQGMTVDDIINGSLKETGIPSYLKDNNLAVAPNQTLWDREGMGFLAELMETFYAERKQFKKMSIENKKKFEETGDSKYKKLSVLYDTIQLARKVLLNSAYGALANTYFRWYNVDFAEAITTTGQMVIQITSRETNAWFNKILGTTDVDYIIANDTDSMYVHFEGIVNKFCVGKTKHETVDFIDKMCKEALEPFLAKIFANIADYTNAYAIKMSMKREAICDRGVWTGKKRYALNVYDLEGVRFEKPKLKVTGLAVVQSNFPAVCRAKIKAGIEIVMTGTNDELIDFIEEFRKDFFKMPFEKVAKNSGVNGIAKYQDKVSRYIKGTPSHVKAAINFNEMVEQRKLTKVIPKIRSGDKIRICYMIQPNPVMDKVLAVPEFLPAEMNDLAAYIDYRTQFEKCFIVPMDAVLKHIGWETEHRPTLNCF